MARIPSPIQQISDPLFDQKGVEVYIKREDLIHPYVMGNKWRKLKYNVAYARERGFQGILTIGGAFSNHIAATAASCRENGLSSIGIIRGEELNAQSNSTLRFAASQGMDLRFVSREDFRSIREHFDQIHSQYPDHYCLPEGGTNQLAIKGCEELVDEIDVDFDYICCTIGTGGTIAGIIKRLNGAQSVLGFPALKGEFVARDLREILKGTPFTNYEIISRFHFGGYGKVTGELIQFINEFKDKTDISLDPIYTGKMFFGLRTLIEEDFFKHGAKIIAIHTGGLQGIEGFNESQKKYVLI